MEDPIQINNDFYDAYGEDWYLADDDPIALLRAENKIKTPWIIERIRKTGMIRPKVLDVGCGAGFLSNELARAGFLVTGVDLSAESLKVAEKYDQTKSVIYHEANAYHLPFPDQSFDVLCAMDFLEHVDNPRKVIQEFSRVLRPGGLFFFHTFNRNPLSWLVVIKMVEWLIPKTPKNMHVLNLFITPEELKNYCFEVDLKVTEMTGIKPVFSSIPLTKIFSGRVPSEMSFEFTPSLMLSYMGVAKRLQ